ncbi:MAG: alanine--glyoxylate aminotransferase family protein [Acidobacteria bacterium]|nr:alanine--glyoxylate aminotransferase family protein [Acidobacteriota bacterium]MDW7985183.1 alanine--glyoxylate aminotransferase family protein [Acidobacteriota bacterium]
MRTASFYPPFRVLMGPGPTEVHPRVLAALARPLVSHFDPTGFRLLDEIRALLQYVFQTRNEVTFVVSGPGTAGMEACVANLVEPGDKVVVCQNGFFSGRIREMVERHGGVAVVVEEEWGRAVDPEKLEDALRRHPDAKVVAFVHAETSTGVLSDAATLAEIARRHGCLTLVDTVTSLGGVPVKVDEWGLDVVYSGSQKCLSAPPGLSPVTFSERALDAVRRRKMPVVSFFLDIQALADYWLGKPPAAGANAARVYHHTVPIPLLYAIHEALTLLREEGLENAWARHRANHSRLRDGLEAMGLTYWVRSEADRIPHLNTIRVPDGVDDAWVRRRLLEDFGIEIGAGLGPLAGRIWRVGLMGYGSHPRNVAYFLSALREVLAR